jgi:MGT family glycosyltransferase
MNGPSVAFFAMPQEGHFHRLRPLISGMVSCGITAYVFTHRRFEPEVEREGATFVDLFEKYPLDQADGDSHPVPCRFVSFAGCYAEDVVDDLQEIQPSLIVYDTFAVIGRVVAALLGVPYVNVCAGHNVDPGRIARLLGTVPRVDISPDCQRAVEKLRERYGLHDASPFYWACALSPFLNVYCEPSAYLTEAEQRAFDPVAFYGCLPSTEEIERTRRGPGLSYFSGAATQLKVYVSFGTVTWRYWGTEALDALMSISESLAGIHALRAVISLGGTEIGPESLRALTKPNVSVASYVDQWKILQEADVFVTHHGLNSTHEAIFNGVPMISYPFLWDQPALAEKCRRFGLAIPLTDSARGPVTDPDVRAALTELAIKRDSLRASLAEARDWELRVMADRDSVLRRMTDLIGV